MSVISQVVTLTQAKAVYNDDFIDRLNYLWTASALGTLALTIFAKDYVGEPLQCWVPNQWKDDWETYAERFCFIENTYYVPMNDSNLPPAEQRESREMIYYQWVPFILALMAFFFALPRMLWEFVSKDLSVGLTTNAHQCLKKATEKTADAGEMLRFVERAVRIDDAESHRNATLFNWYIITKVLNLANVFLQFFFLNHFLGTNYLFWGLGLLMDLLSGRHWQESGFFPRIAFCDVSVREMGNTNNWTVQCVLMVNMFNEKIFVIIWWWLVVLLGLSVMNIIIWFKRRFATGDRVKFLSKLKAQANVEEDDINDEEFFKYSLRDDGVFVLRILDENAGRLISSDLYKALREHYRGLLDTRVNTSRVNSSD